MKRVKRAWNGGSREAAMEASRRRTEEAIMAGCERCPTCHGSGLLEANVCKTCGAAGFLVPPDGMPLPRVTR